MRKLLVAFIFVLLPPLAAQEPASQDAPRVERFRLENGLTVRVARRYYDLARFHFGLAGALPPN